MNKFDSDRNAYMLKGSLAKKGYMRWWHSFTGVQPDTGQQRTFFIEYFVINPALGGEQPILGQHPFFKKRGMKPSYVMVKAGCFPISSDDTGIQLHAFYPISSLRVAQHPLYMEVEDCLFSENRISGFVDVTETEARHRSLMTDAGYMEWDLEVHKAVACHTGFIANRFFTALHALESFWHGEGIRTLFRGTVSLNGIVYEVSSESSYGYADKHWGRNFNKPWLQLASCRLTSERTGRELKHSALAVDGCCPKFLFFPMRKKLMMQLTYTGEDFEYNFARPGSFSRCKWKVKETNRRFIWHILAQNKTSVIKISASCLKEQMTAVNYEAPDGSRSGLPLYAGGAGLGTIQIYRRVPGGRQLIDTLTMQNALCEYGLTDF